MFPAPRGPYGVGCADLAGAGVFMRLFFPSRVAAAGGDHSRSRRTCRWFPEADYAAAYLGFKYARPFPAWLGRLLVWALGDPVCAAEENPPSGLSDRRRFPLVVFSHGNGGCRSTYSMFCTEVASRGFLVAAVEHADGSASAARTYNAAEDRLEWVPVRRVGPGDDYDARNEQVTKRSEECKAAYDLIEKLNDGKTDGVKKPFDKDDQFDLSSLEGGVDLTDGALICGHSFGGATAVKALQTYDCFTLGFCLDAWLFPIKHEAEALRKRAEKPLAFFNYEKFQWKRNLQTMSTFEGTLSFQEEDETDNNRLLSSNVYTVKNAIHYAASDIPTLFANSPLQFPISAMRAVSSLFRGSDATAEEKSLTPEQTLTASEELFLAFSKAAKIPSSSLLFAKETRDFVEYLSELDEHLILGTKYMDNCD